MRPGGRLPAGSCASVRGDKPSSAGSPRGRRALPLRHNGRDNGLGLHETHGSPDFIALHKSTAAAYVPAVEAIVARQERQAADCTRQKMNLVKSYSAWRKYRETRIALDRLSDRALSDIGVSRRDIRSVARKAI